MNSTIPSLDPRGPRPGRPFLRSLWGAILGWGVVRFALQILDLFGRGESALDIYKLLPKIVSFLGNPAFSTCAIVGGFLLLAFEARNLEPVPKKVLVHPTTKLPLRVGPRYWAKFKLPVCICVVASIAALLIWSFYRTPIRSYFIAVSLPPLPNHSPAAPRDLGPPIAASPTPPARAVVSNTVSSEQENAPTISAQKPAPSGSAQTNRPPTNNSTAPPAGSAENPSNDGAQSAYGEVQNVLERVRVLNGTWTEGVSRWKHLGETAPNDPSKTKALQERSDLEIARLNDAVSEQWRSTLGLVSTAVKDAFTRMNMPGPKQLSPNEFQLEEQELDAAWSVAGKGVALEDIQGKRFNEQRFEPMQNFLQALLQKLGDYPESPMHK
jgi:hypothetical protein